jgi:hypothetical protein
VFQVTRSETAELITSTPILIRTVNWRPPEDDVPEIFKYSATIVVLHGRAQKPFSEMPGKEGWEDFAVWGYIPSNAIIGGCSYQEVLLFQSIG